MGPEVNPEEAARVFEAFESGRLDQLFIEANTHYYDHSGFNGLRIGVGVPRESAWRLISAIRRATGLLILESAWGDFQVRVTPTAELMEAIYHIDTAPAQSLLGKTALPPDEEWIVQDRLMVEEAVLVALGKTLTDEPSKGELAQARREVISALYDDTTPSTEAGIVATRFYRTMRALPDSRSLEITPNYITDIHELLLKGEPDAGVLRKTPEPESSNSLFAAPTSPERIMGELQAMHAYSTSKDVPFVHPLIKSLGLAWWIRRVAPFDRYNYLVSRLVSMAYAIRHGYRAAGILDPGRIVPGMDESGGDLTAAFIAQLEIIYTSRRIRDNDLHLREARFLKVTERFAPLGANHRQAFILDRALRNPETHFTIKHHARTRELAYETARQDFVRLVNAGLMEQHKRGKAYEFRLAQDAEGKMAKRLG